MDKSRAFRLWKAGRIGTNAQRLASKYQYDSEVGDVVLGLLAKAEEVTRRGEVLVFWSACEDQARDFHWSNGDVGLS